MEVWTLVALAIANLVLVVAVFLRKPPADDAARAGDLEIAVVRAGSSPGMHLVGFDAPGETIELRLTARDRSAYAAGALAAAAWLSAATPRSAGCHPFDAVVDEITQSALAATA